MTTVTVPLGGFYTYTAWSNLSDDGTMPQFKVTVNEGDNTIQGQGSDKPGTFAIAGVLVGDEVRFIKQYYNSNGNVAWKYVGKRLDPKGNVYQFSGGWGQGAKQFGQWVLSGVAPDGPKPRHPIEGQWEGTYAYANNVSQQDGPMNLTISLDDSAPYNVDGPYTLKGTGTDGIGSFTLHGTITKNNDVDLTKTYNVNGQVWSWRYQGLFDSAGAIGGIWRDTNDDAASPRGSFQLSLRNSIPKATAQAIVPASRVLASVSSQSAGTVSSAVQALKGKGGQVSAAQLDSLLTGFTTL